MTSYELTDKIWTNMNAEILIHFFSGNITNPITGDPLNNILEDYNRLEDSINFSSVSRIDSNQIISEEKSELNYSTCTNSRKY